MLWFDVTLEIFSKLIKPLIRKTIDCIDELLKNKNMMINEIDHIIMIGGSSKLLDNTKCNKYTLWCKADDISKFRECGIKWNMFANIIIGKGISKQQ